MKRENCILEGIVKDLKTGASYELGGTIYNESSRMPEGDGLVLLRLPKEKGGDTIQKLETTVLEGTNMARASLTLVAKLEEWERVD